MSRVVPTKTLNVSTNGDILICAIDIPPHNYLQAQFFEDLYHCRDVMRAAEVKSVVFTAKGRVFSKGADIDQIRRHPDAISRESLVFANDLLTFISRLDKPTVAAVNGLCLGGGLELALACHLRVCSDKARFGLPELNLGLVPGLGGIHRLSKVVGEAKALEMLLLSDIISAQKALSCHLVSRIFPHKDFHNQVMMFVKNLIAVPQAAMREMLRLVCIPRADNENEVTQEVVESFFRLFNG